MRGLLLVAVVVGSFVRVASAEPVRPQVPSGQPTCITAASALTTALGVDFKATLVLERRCEADRWTRDAKVCFSAAQRSTEASLCLDTLSKKQRTTLEGDADRLNDARLGRWLMRRTLIAPAQTLVTLASYEPPTADAARARALHSQAMSAYQAGNFELSSKKFEAAIDVSPTADNVYLAAQASRMKGDRARALELYERYLEIAPRGPAAPACRYQIERLRDAIP